MRLPKFSTHFQHALAGILLKRQREQLVFAIASLRAVLKQRDVEHTVVERNQETADDGLEDRFIGNAAQRKKAVNAVDVDSLDGYQRRELRVSRANRRSLRTLRDLDLVVVLLETIPSVPFDIPSLVIEKFLAQIGAPRCMQDVPADFVFLVEEHNATILFVLHFP